MNFVEKVDDTVEVRIPLDKWNELTDLLDSLHNDVISPTGKLSRTTEDYYWKLMSF